MMILCLRRAGPRTRAVDADTPPRTRARRGGFTLVELLVVVSIVGILTGLAIPNMKVVLVRARAAQVAGDMEVVRTAVHNYMAQRNVWPAEAPAGTVPTGLEEFLPAGYSFDRNGYQLDYENWDLPGGLPGDPSTHTLIGVSAVISDPSLGNALVELLGNAIVSSVGNTHTVVIDRS
jgi:prepilin-type N-terminal cleavage/methylation domain-containing protein